MLRVFVFLLVAAAARGYSLFSLSRRSFMASTCSAPILVLSNVSPAHAADSRSEIEGRYSDPNHPKGYRQVTLTANTLTIDGSDSSKDAQSWSLKGSTSDGVDLVIDFSPKGGPKDLKGKFVGDGIVFPDGNKW